MQKKSYLRAYLRVIETTAQRVRELRDELQLSRIDFAKQFNVNINTLKSWEVGQNKLTDDSAISITKTAELYGLICTPEWLIFGVGIPPYFIEKNKDVIEQLSLQENILKEAEYFISLHKKKGVIKVIGDNSMSPFLLSGDYVGGIMLSPEVNRLRLNNKTGGSIYLVETKCMSVIRFVNIDNKDRIFLVPADKKEFNCDIISSKDISLIAEIVWRRKTFQPK